VRGVHIRGKGLDRGQWRDDTACLYMVGLLSILAFGTICDSVWYTAVFLVGLVGGSVGLDIYCFGCWTFS
jgi:hypothetical protein